MTDDPKRPQGDEPDAEATTELPARTAPEPAAAPSESTRPRPSAWQRVPKTIPHTRARTSTVVLVLLFLGLMWWYLDLYAQFVPEEQRRTGQTPVATTTAPAREAPTYDGPTTTPSPTPSSAVPSRGEVGESGAPSSTVPGSSGEPTTAPARTATTTSAPGGIVLPGGATLPGGTTEPPTSGGAPTTTVPAG
ncbi:hypothetical protein FK529_09170 [Tsukamurella asaccharolytica]|uniref:Uncharacterized protein n=1 Tax=Tsukamurella asaccharolytica TaxID=2592067 RepID=A0A5C5R850_9ACTN|nr:hypothetical protein [Tsukamurella asaccharolytica]TWS19367.1 hypothetical protein FK529_09170 [Tsukamurella asaccharolytica]